MESDIGQELGSLIRMLRFGRKCKAYAMAEYIGMSRFNYSKYEKGERFIHAHNLIKLSSFFGEDGEAVWTQFYRDIKAKGLLDGSKDENKDKI